ncbi:unnamed protein product [Malus baccata var. baccata]
MVQRLTYRARHSYATKSNQHRIVKTPGGKLVYQTTKKRASGPKCPVTGKRIQGIPHLRPTEYKRSRLSRNRRTVNRAYGGVLSGGAVKERFVDCIATFFFPSFNVVLHQWGLDNLLSIGLQDHQGLSGGGTKDREKGVEDSKDKGKASCKDQVKSTKF